MNQKVKLLEIHWDLSPFHLPRNPIPIKDQTQTTTRFLWLRSGFSFSPAQAGKGAEQTGKKEVCGT